MRKPSLDSSVPAFALLAALMLAWWAYHPGLSGGFLFDDFGNLPSLGATGPIDNAPAFWRYVTSGSADPTGRPLALVSFLIDAHNWPADPRPFKRTSILLHLLNGVLLTWLLVRLGRALDLPRVRSELAAVLASALWLLHPLLLSTTLYIVQREAMLPGTFILIGLIGYVAGRDAAVRGRRSGAWLAGFSIVVGTVLGVLSKANGALLPLMAYIVEACLLAPRAPVADARTARTFTTVRYATLILPSILLFAYLAKVAWSGFFHGLDAERPWTLGERLLTEGRIVTDYLGLLWVPRPYTAGLFNDAYRASTGLLSPPTTFFALLFLGALLGTAIAIRRRHPVLAVAILFFFAGQLLESTVIALELYFEHRNYVPAMLMFWPLALWLCSAPASATGGAMPNLSRSQEGPFLGQVRVGIALVLPLGLAVLTYLRADLWGNPQDQALIWAIKNPDSPRAQAYAAQIEIERGQVAAAGARLEKALAARPDEIQLALNLVGARCTMGTLTAADLGRAAYALSHGTNAGRLGYDWFERSLPVAQKRACTNLDLASIESLLDAAAANPRTRDIPGRRQDVAHLRGRIALLRGDGPRALEYFNDALQADVRPGAALEQAGILATAGYPALALRHLDLLQRIWPAPAKTRFDMTAIHNWLLVREGYWQHEIAHLRQALAEDLSNRASQRKSSE